MALISRYHRRKGRSRKHKEFTRLAPDEQAIVRRPAGLSRVADERGADLSLECWSANRKANVLAKQLGRAVVVAPAAVG